ncbi:beta-glucosidase/6-phospho-beta-glucosidase/beta-galactosidase [Sphingomonas sp. PvP056]|jgi:beta-glucosidase
MSDPKSLIGECGRSANCGIGDSDRIMYLRNYLAEFHRATVEGYPLKGYFL